MNPQQLAQVLLDAHKDALLKARLARKRNRHQDAAQLELIALSLRCRLGHEPSKRLEALLVSLVDQPLPDN